MPNSRRGFIRTAGLVAGAAALGGLPLTASEPMVSAAERSVSGVIARYGSCVRINRDEGRTTTFEVTMHSYKRFAEVFDPRRLPFERIYVGPANTLKFKHQGAEFRIVNFA